MLYESVKSRNMIMTNQFAAIVFYDFLKLTKSKFPSWLRSKFSWKFFVSSAAKAGERIVSIESVIANLITFSGIEHQCLN